MADKIRIKTRQGEDVIQLVRCVTIKDGALLVHCYGDDIGHIRKAYAAGFWLSFEDEPS